MSYLKTIKIKFFTPVIWPSLQEELKEYLQYFTGNVLNAGAGDRDISPFISGKLFNQDLPGGLHTKNIHVYSNRAIPLITTFTVYSIFLLQKIAIYSVMVVKGITLYSNLDSIPIKDGFFDAIICNAVLEHVDNPNQVMKEFNRVVKRGGHLYLCVPFLQPEHLSPGDFQRYTKYGLKKLVENNGFSIVKLEGVHSVYHTLARIVQDWLTSKNCFKYRLLRLFIFPLLNYKTRHSKTYVDTMASAYRVLAIKK